MWKPAVTSAQARPCDKETGGVSTHVDLAEMLIRCCERKNECHRLRRLISIVSDRLRAWGVGLPGKHCVVCCSDTGNIDFISGRKKRSLVLIDRDDIIGRRCKVIEKKTGRFFFLPGVIEDDERDSNFDI